MENETGKKNGSVIDAPRRTVLMALNCGRASLKARISVGQTKVKSLRGTKNRSDSKDT